MTSKESKIFGAMGTAAAAIGAYAFVKYFQTQTMKDLGLIAKEVRYVRKYDGENPAETIDEVLDRIIAVTESNPGYVTQIQEFKTGIENYKVVLAPIHDEAEYDAILDEVSEKMRDFVRDNRRDPKLLVVGVGATGVAAMCYILSAATRGSDKAKELPVANEIPLANELPAANELPITKEEPPAAYELPMAKEG